MSYLGVSKLHFSHKGNFTPLKQPPVDEVWIHSLCPRAYLSVRSKIIHLLASFLND